MEMPRRDGKVLLIMLSRLSGDYFFYIHDEKAIFFLDFPNHSSSILYGAGNVFHGCFGINENFQPVGFGWIHL